MVILPIGLSSTLMSKKTLEVMVSPAPPAGVADWRARDGVV